MADAAEASEDLGDALLYALGAISDDSDDGVSGKAHCRAWPVSPVFRGIYRVYIW